jgi:hypothetical protein
MYHHSLHLLHCQQSLKTPEQYIAGPWNLTASDAPACAHVVRDERYISARWPGDAQAFSEAIFEEAVRAGVA